MKTPSLSSMKDKEPDKYGGILFFFFRKISKGLRGLVMNMTEKNASDCLRYSGDVNLGEVFKISRNQTKPSAPNGNHLK